LEKIDAVIRVHFGINPDELSTDEWAKLFQQWVYVQRAQLSAQEAMFEATLSRVMYKVANDVFKAIQGKK